MPYNISSPNAISSAVDINDPKGWFSKETELLPKSLRDVLRIVLDNESEFVQWPREAILLWQGCNRIPHPGQRLRYHNYPEKIRQLAKEKNIYLDGRPNGPAVAAFEIAGGQRPKRFGSANKWSIHHLYSGKFPSPGHEKTTHAVKEKNHFTQSAGLLAAHPLIDALFDELPAIVWLFRFESYKRFGYDPDGVFTNGQIDGLGFAPQKGGEILAIVSE